MARFLTPSVLALCAALLAGVTPAGAIGPRDPFTPPGKEAVVVVPPLESLSTVAPPVGAGLTGMRFGARPQALIDGEWVAVGKTVRGARLARLLPQHAVLVHPGGREERLPLFPIEAPSSPASAASSPDTSEPVDTAALK